MSKDRTEADVAFIEALAQILERNALTEISVSREYGKDDGLEVHLSKVPPSVAAAPAPAPAQSPAIPATQSTAPHAADGTQDDADHSDPARHPGAVTSPMVGTAYLSPEPGSDPFTSVGSQVAEGQTLLIIEAMKTMNHIPAPRSGTVKRILIGDATPVEFGAPLMIIE